MQWLTLAVSSSVTVVAMIVSVMVIGYRIVRKIPKALQTDGAQTDNHLGQECKDEEGVEIYTCYTASCLEKKREDSMSGDSSDDRPRASLTIDVETLRKVGLSILKDLLMNLAQNLIEANTASGHQHMDSDVVVTDNGSHVDVCTSRTHDISPYLEHEHGESNRCPLRREDIPGCECRIPGCECPETVADDGGGNPDGGVKRDQITRRPLPSLSCMAEVETAALWGNLDTVVHVLFVNDRVKCESFLSTLLAVKCATRVQLLIDAIFRAFRVHNGVLRNWDMEQGAIEEDGDVGNVTYTINHLWNSITFSCIASPEGIDFIEATEVLDPGLEKQGLLTWSERVAFRLANHMVQSSVYVRPDSSSVHTHIYKNTDARQISKDVLKLHSPSMRQI